MKGNDNQKQSQTVAVVGLGYVGLPLALLFLEKDYTVIGIDTDKEKIKKLKRGNSYIFDIPDSAIKTGLANNRFHLTDDYDAIKKAYAIIVCVPTPLSNRTPDITYLLESAKNISSRAQAGQVIILESSTYPGTTQDLIGPLFEKKGLVPGTDIFLGLSPERLDPGNKEYTLSKIPKIISGITEKCKEKIYQLYGDVFQKVVPVSSPEVAEMAKLLENTYRFINISFINEFAQLCDAMNLNIWEIIEAAGTKTFGFTPFYPGPGIGGHCIPVVPMYLQHRFKHYGVESRFIQLAEEVNEEMPVYVVNVIKNSMVPLGNKGQIEILVYGVAYKGDINDLRDSAAAKVISLLCEEGFQVSYHDPYIPSLCIGDIKMNSIELTEDVYKKIDCAVILTNHSVVPIQDIIDGVPLVIDARNATKDLQGKATIIKVGGGGSPKLNGHGRR